MPFNKDTDRSPRLGCATTLELLDELACRVNLGYRTIDDFEGSDVTLEKVGVYYSSHMVSLPVLEVFEEDGERETPWSIALQTVARGWCDPECGEITMDPTLAKGIARVLLREGWAPYVKDVNRHLGPQEDTVNQNASSD